MQSLKPLRVLCIHNSYQQAGGEDSVFANEVQLLQAGGHVVAQLRVSNDGIDTVGERVRAALEVVHNPQGRKLVAKAIHDFSPDIVHVHNFFPKLSPAIFDACTDAAVASVWTLHNFRVVCANGLLFREGKVCEDCVGRAPLPAIKHRCYRGSRVGTTAVATMIGFHAAAGTWRKKVTRFIALNTFARDILIRSGLPADRIVIKPNFSWPAARESPRPSHRHGALYVGRLSAEKGVVSLVEAWRNVDIPLTILGDGPERAGLQTLAPPHVTFAGHAPPADVATAMTQAQALIMPSVCYENFPMTVAEAMAAGTPVIASKLGAMSRIVEDGVTGLHFTPGDARDLARVATAAFSNPKLLSQMGAQAQAYWRTEMSPQANLLRLESIYEDAMIDVENTR